MNRFVIWAVASMVIVCGVLESSSDAARRRGRVFRRPAQQQQAAKFWPFDEQDEVAPDVVVPDEPEPLPEPLPPEPPAPEPGFELPGGAELNSHVAKELGGYSRGNHVRNGTELQVYTKYGPNVGIAVVITDCEDWMSAIGRAFCLESEAETTNAGVVLVCDTPTPQPEPDQPVDPQPEPDQPVDPQPEPEVEPLPDPEVEPLPEPTDREESLPVFKCGGEDLLRAEKAARRAGIYLWVLHRDTGKVFRVVSP